MNRILNGDLNVDDVNLNFKIINGYGIDAELKINEITSINNRTGNNVSLSHSIIGDQIHVNRASYNNGNIIPSVFIENFNNQNSNIDLILENLGNELQYDFEVSVNPLGDLGNQSDFASNKSPLHILLDAEVPLKLSTDQLTIVDTLNITFNEDILRTNNAEVIAKIKNGFPIDFKFQLYILDSANQIIDSVMTDQITLDAGLIDGNMYVSNKSYTEFNFTLTNNQLQQINKTGKLLLKTINTSNPTNQNLVIYSEYKVDIQLILNANYEINID